MDDDYDLAPHAPPPIPQRRPATRAPGVTSGGGGAATSVDSASGCYAVGDVIVVRDGAVLPPRCVMCNAPGDGKPMRKRFAYNEDESGMSAARLIPIIGPIVAAVWVIKGLSTRQYVGFTYSLCGRHQVMRNASYVLMAVLGLSAAGVFAHGMSLMNGSWMFGGLALFIAAVIIGAKGTATLKLSGVRRAGAEVKGAGRAFRDSLPRPGAAPRYR